MKLRSVIKSLVIAGALAGLTPTVAQAASPPAASVPQLVEGTMKTRAGKVIFTSNKGKEVDVTEVKAKHGNLKAYFKKFGISSRTKAKHDRDLFNARMNYVRTIINQ
tara:strand:+ start:106 stop:426 length:321 start_codon:yes stop_codon:yes gene_type:complete